jgi:hypothetical protein
MLIGLAGRSTGALALILAFTRLLSRLHWQTVQEKYVQLWEIKYVQGLFPFQ